LVIYYYSEYNKLFERKEEIIYENMISIILFIIIGLISACTLVLLFMRKYYGMYNTYNYHKWIKIDKYIEIATILIIFLLASLGMISK